MMAMQVKYFPHTADIEFEAYGSSMEKVFALAALAMQNAMTDTKRVGKKIKKNIAVESESMESLLYDFLERLLILHDSENLVFSKITVKKIWQEDGKYKLSAIAEGEEFDAAKHESRTLVKAITYHAMQIGKKKITGKEKYFVHLVLDI